MNQKNKKTRHLGRKVGGLTLCLLVVNIVAVLALCVFMFYSLVMNMLKAQCINGTNMLSYELQTHDSEDMTQLLDDLKEQMNCEFTIFQGDQRAYTTIQQNGERLVGTKLSEELADTILVQGKSYVGKAEIMGVQHLCSYVPTTDDKGQINGLIFAGISMAEATTQINFTVFAACAAGAVMIILSIMLMSLFISRSVSRPLSKLTLLAQTMEEGKLGLGQEQNLTVNIHSNDEIGLLSSIFENTILRLRGYIGEISTILESISNGNLTAGTTQDYIGDFTSIKSSLDDILNKLNDTMSQIVESSDHVSNGSKQMSIGAQALSQGAVEQSSAVEELEGTIQTISLQVQQTAQRAEQASLKVEEVSEHLSESNRKMQEMIQAMEEISESSNEIGKIIRTIENIAQQTNILALNSSVEAARAGEAGKGFAVVAKEVQELAGQSTEASKSTNSLIEHSIRSVAYGTKIAHETAVQLASVVEGTSQVVEATNWIADAARTQAESVVQIQNRIIQISDVVQTNSATAEESAATSQELNSQAGLLKNLIGMFHLKQQ
ncbi:MAG: HAMP domain-containing protein [Lachnospiraceae bacterium]|nr:HAMP domain-containing protein [Lachnospiraceae bacterium]